MAVDDLDATDGTFELVGPGPQVGKHIRVGTALLFEHADVMPDRVEYPEYQGGASQMFRNAAMAPPDQPDETGKHVRVADIGLAERVALDELEYQHPRLGMHDAGGKSGRMRSDRGPLLLIALDQMHRQVLADSYEIRRSGIPDTKVRVGYSALEALHLRLTFPDPKVPNTLGCTVFARTHASP